MPYRRVGSKKWWIVVSGIRKSSGTDDFEAAKALEAKLNHEAWLRNSGLIEKIKLYSWKEAVVKYLTERRHKASFDTMRQRLLWWDAHIGNINDIRIINRDMIDKLLQQHRPITALPSSGNTTANKYAIVVGSVLNSACREWNWIPSSPKLRRYPEPDHRRIFLTVEQWLALLNQLPEHLVAPATFSLATGLRAGKVFSLEWNQIDFRNRALKTIGNGIKRGNTIPLNQTAMGVLEGILSGNVHHLTRVFCYKGKPLGDYGKAWFKACHRAGLGEYKEWKENGLRKSNYEGFPWHGFRHTFASWLGQAGVPEDAIDQLCGWAEKDTRGIYTHLNVEPLRRYCEVIDAQLATQTLGLTLHRPLSA